MTAKGSAHYVMQSYMVLIQVYLSTSIRPTCN